MHVRPQYQQPLHQQGEEHADQMANAATEKAQELAQERARLAAEHAAKLADERAAQRAAHVAFAPLGWESERVLWIAWACGAAPFGRLTADLMRHIAAELRPLYPPNIRQICGARRVPR